MPFPIPDIANHKRWVFKDMPSQAKIANLSAAINVNATLAGILVQRGIDNFEKAEQFFKPSLAFLHDPYLMKDMDLAVNRVNQAIQKQEKILIYGDYDVDGTTSVSLVYLYLKNYYDHVAYYLPDRYAEGYGVSSQGIEWARAHGYSLIITLDCGIKAAEKVLLAKKYGIDVIICDHHNTPEILPDAVAVLDPKRPDCPYPYKELSGCGVGFKLMNALAIANDWEIEILYQYLDLLTVSIASDIVPITGENRILAHYGLIKLNSKPIPGLAAIKKVAKVNSELTISGVVFTIGPRINAAGRIDHAKTAVDLLTCTEADQAYKMAVDIEHKNLERRDVDKKITEEALSLIASDEVLTKASSTVLFKEDWHKGVIGIVASRCIERYYRPTIIMTKSNGKATGSARSVDGFDLYEAISQCADLLDQYGGHTHAAGLTMDINNIAAFNQRFEEIVSSQLAEKQTEPPLEIDYKIKLDHINAKLLRILKRMEPFGPENLQPIFYAEELYTYGQVEILKDEHIKFSVRQQDSDQIIQAIGFNMKAFYEGLCSGLPYMMAFHIDENNFNGRKSLQLRVKDIRFC